MPSKKTSNSSLIAVLAMAVGIGFIITGVLSDYTQTWRSILMAGGFFVLLYGIFAYRK